MSERRCILSSEHGDPAALIRLAISPDGDVLPDVRARAPGRGAWLGVDRATLEQAMAKGRLKGALARAFKGETLSVPDDLAERIGAALQSDFMARLGLEAKSSNLATGFDKIDVAARRGQVRMLLHAADAGDDGVRKLDQAWRVGEEREGEDFAGIRLPVDREALSMALGRHNVVHIAVTNAAAAGRISGLLGRWQSYLGCANAAPNSGSAVVRHMDDDPAPKA
jgi:Predicted nucleic-acid-binding protein implicated in transcription termination